MFEFKHTHETGSVTVTTSENFLPEILMVMEEFLKGCGFYINGTLDIVKDEE